jgi:predicted flap endonuclease-1-like 5' DNA nuclease
MLAFLARTFLLLAAAFGLGAIGGRTARHRARRSAPSPVKEQPQERAAASDLVIASESGADTSGSDVLAGLPAEPATLAEPATGDADVPAAIDEPAVKSIEPSGTTPAETQEAPAGKPAFASYGGSGFVAGVVLSEPRLDTAAAEDMEEREDPALLAAPDVHGRTPTAHEREALPADPLAQRHQTDTLDFKTVDYGNMKAAERTAAETAFRDDGWTVPEGYQMPVAGEHADSAASFKSGGGSGAVHGAPDLLPKEEPGSGETEDAGAAGEVESSATAPRRLDAARGDAPDDLTRIFGIGPSIERLLFDNGIFHFEQIAGWTDDEVRWADELSGFAGRVRREQWIEQAKALAAESQQA